MHPLRWLSSIVLPFAAMFALGGLWNTVLAGAFHARHAPAIARSADGVSMAFLVAGYGAATAFMAFLFPQSFRARVGLADGFRFGALFGLVMTLPTYLLLHAGWDVHLGMLLADSGWHAFEKGVGGMLMAALFRPSGPPPDASATPS